MFNRAECRLREIEEVDLPQLLHWRNRDAIRRVMYTDHLITPEEHRRWFAKRSGNRAESASQHWLFEYQGKLLGQVNVVDIHRTHQRCQWGFYIGEADAPKGSGMAMGILALDRIFGELKLNRVCGEALAFNEASIRYHKALGFQLEGCMRQHICKAEAWYDVICFGLLRSEWEEKRHDLMERWLGGDEWKLQAEK